jgi:hypothetical protein
VANAEHRGKAIQQKLDRLDDAFIYKESIDLGTYERQRDRLREELTLVEIDRHGFEARGVRRRGHPQLCGAGATARLGSLDSGVVWSNGSGFRDCFFRQARRSAEKPSIEPS